MAVEVARLLVRIGADTADAERGLQRAQVAVQGFSGFLRQAAASATGFATAMVGMRAIDSAVSAAQGAIIGFNASLEQSRIAFTTMLRSGEAAQAFLFDLQQFAAQTPFEFQDVERGAKRLLAMGFAAKDVKPLLTSVGDAAAALGLGAPGIDRITLALGQMQAKAKVSAEEMLQLTEAGIPAWEILAEAVGKPIPHVMKLAEQGQIASSVFIDAFQRFSQQRWGGMMEQQSKTFLGALSTIKDSLNIVASTAFQPLFQRISELARRIAEFVQSDQFQVWGARVAATIEVILEGLGVLASGFGAVFRGIASIVTSVGRIIFQALQLLNPFARHSPSLVESVEAGVDIIINRFASLRAVETPLRAAGNAVRALGDAARDGLAALEAATDAARAKTLAVFGSAVPAAFHAAQQAVGALEAELVGLKAATQAQESAVEAVKGELDAATDVVRAKEKAIRALERETRSYDAAVEAADANVRRMRESVDQARGMVDRLRDAISAAQDRLRQFADAPIKGTKEFDDRLFSLNQQINQTQLQIARLKLGGVTTKGGELELLERQLETLRLQAEEVRLEKALALDPLRRHIDALAKPVKELPFDEIVKGILAEQQNLAQLDEQLGQATATWKHHATALRDAEAELKTAQSARDQFRKSIDAERIALEQLRDAQAAVQERYAAEQARLSELKDAYSAVQRQIDQYRKSIDSVLQSAEQQVRLNEQAEKAVKGAGDVAGAMAQAPADRLAGLDLSETQGQLEEWKAQFESTKEDLRQNLLPTFESFRTTLESIGFALQQVSSLIDRLKEPLGLLTDMFGGLLDRAQSVWPQVSGTISRAVNDISSVVSKVLATLTRTWDEHGSTILDRAKHVWDTITSVITDAVGIVFAIIGAVLDAIAKAWETHGDSIMALARDIWNGILAVISAVTNIVVPFVIEQLGIIVEWVNNNWPLIQRTIGNVMSFVLLIVKAALSAIVSFWQDHGDKIMAIVSLVWDIVTTVVSTAIKVVLGIIKTIMHIINGEWMDAWESIKNVISVIWNAIVSIISSIIRFLVDAIIKPTLETIVNIWNTAWGAIATFFSDRWNDIVNTAKGAINTIIQFINQLIGAWNKLKFEIPKVDIQLPEVTLPTGVKVGGQRLQFAGATIAFPQLAPIPELAEGGIVRRPTLALLGEGGPEAVIPLRSQTAPAAVTVNVYVSGSVIAERDLADTVRRELLRVGRRNLGVGLA